MDHVVEGPEGTVTGRREPARPRPADRGRALQPGEKLRIVKFLATAGRVSVRCRRCATRSPLALETARRAGWKVYSKSSATSWTEIWERADVQIDGDPEIQQAVRFALFHVFQAAARAEQRAIPAKGLTGSGYDGHTFWDTDAYTLPVLTSSTRARRAIDRAGVTPRWTSPRRGPQSSSSRG